MTLGQTLYSLRTKANMTQEQLAEKMHVSRQSISKWESDAARPDLEKLKMLADLYQISMDELLGKETDAAPVIATDHTATKNTAFLQLKRMVLGLGLITLFLAAALIGITVHLSRRISDLKDQIVALPAPVYTYPNTENGNDTDDYFQSFSQKVLSVDNDMAQVQFTTVLKSYTDTTTLSLQLRSQSDTESTPVDVLLSQENNTFTGTASLPVNADTYQITAVIDTDGQKQSVDVETDTPFSLLVLTDWQPYLELENISYSNGIYDGNLSLAADSLNQLSHISDVTLEIKNNGTPLYTHIVDKSDLDIIRNNEFPCVGYNFQIPNQDEIPDLTLYLTWYNDILQKYITYQTSVTDTLMRNDTNGSFTLFKQDTDYGNPPVTISLSSEKSI